VTRPASTLPPRPSTAVIARVLTDETTHATTGAAPSVTRRPRRRSGRWRRRVQQITGVVMLGLLAMGVVVLSSPATANASVCIDGPKSNTWGPDGVRTGVDGLIDQTGPNGTFSDPLPGSYPNIDAAIADTGHTDYEKLGTAGALWSVDYGSQDSDDNSCFPITKVVGNFLANTIFSISKVGARLAISTYQWATSPGILNPLNGPLDEVVHSYWNGLVKYLLGAAILFGVATVMWLTLVRRRFSLGLGGIVWMVVAVTALLLFVVKPSAVASKMDKTISDVTNLSFSGGSNSMEAADPHIGAVYKQIRNQPNGAQRIASDMMWRVLVFQPWAAGQWGESSGKPIVMQTNPQPSDTPGSWYNGTRDARYQQLYSQACVLDPKVSICNQMDSEPNAAQIPVSAVLAGSFINAYALNWYMVENWTCTSAHWCVGPEGNPDGGANNDDRSVTNSNGWGYRSVWSGDKPEQRMLAGFTSMISTISLGAIIFLFAAVIITFDLVLYMLLFLAEFLLLLGIQPTWGRRLVEGLATQILQNGLKRIMAGLLLSVLVVVFGVIQSMTLGWAAKVGLMVGVGVAAVLLRKPLMDTLGVVRVGQGSSAMEGTEDSAAAKLIGTSRKTARKGSTTATRYGRKTAAGAAHSPTRIRRGYAGSRVGVEVARDRIHRAAEAGAPMSTGQQRRTRIAAALTGARTGSKANNRFVAERDASHETHLATGMRATTYERQGNRRFARTEQGKASTVAQEVRSEQKQAQARTEKLTGRDEDIRMAATVKPSRFTGTAQNFDHYEGQAPVYVDRNRRRSAGPTAGKHHRRRDQAILRGAETLPPAPPPEQQQDRQPEPAPLPAAVPVRRRGGRRITPAPPERTTPMRSAAPYRPETQPSEDLAPIPSRSVPARAASTARRARIVADRPRERAAAAAATADKAGRTGEQ